MQIGRTTESAYGNHAIRVPVIVPAVRMADLQAKAEAVQAGRPAFVPQLRSEIRFIAKKADSLKAVSPRRIAGQKIRVRPVRHVGGMWQPFGMDRILQDVQVGAGMGKIIGRDAGKKNVPRRAELITEKTGQCDQNACGRNFLGQIHRETGLGQRRPGLIDPGLGAGYFSALLERGNFPRLPGFLPGGIRQILSRKIKMDLHETPAR